MTKLKSYVNKIVCVLCAIVMFSLGFVAGRYADDIRRFLIPPTVSVVMSTYNRADALPTAIESILEQTRGDFEFIIINDGSSDNTEEVILSYAAKDPRIVYLKNETNQGLIYSLNRGIDAARGKYIARMDDDDKSVPFRFERQVLAMDNHPEIALMGTSFLGKDGVPKEKTGEPIIRDPDQVEINTYFSSGLAHPTIMIRRDFLNKHHIRYDKEYLYAEDCGLYKDILNKGGKISSVAEQLLYLGYIKGLSHPDQYSHIQGETFKKIQKEKLDAFFDVPYEMLGAFKSVINKCEILNKMVPVNRDKKILNQELLEKMQTETCQKAEKLKDAIEVKHPTWEDHIAIEDNGRFSRVEAPGETGQIKYNKDKTVTLQWDKWKPEIFRVKDPKHYVYLKDIDGNVKKKK